jgi:hypothetical protein
VTAALGAKGGNQIGSGVESAVSEHAIDVVKFQIFSFWSSFWVLFLVLSCFLSFFLFLPPLGRWWPRCCCLCLSRLGLAYVASHWPVGPGWAALAGGRGTDNALTETFSGPKMTLVGPDRPRLAVKRSSCDLFLPPSFAKCASISSHAAPSHLNASLVALLRHALHPPPGSTRRWLVRSFSFLQLL